MDADGESGREIYGMCFDAASGKELWRRRLPATRTTDMASGFSDNTAASPVSDGKLVCFVNVGGSIQTYDLEGNLKWRQEWVPFGRHHARQQEPILLGGKVIFLRTVATDLAESAASKGGAKPLGRDKKYWTRLHALNLATGKLVWVAESASSVHAASMMARAQSGHMAIMTGRGGGHQPPEEPYGMSMIDARNGKTIWDAPIKNYAAHQNCAWTGGLATAFIGDKHHLIEDASGELLDGVSLLEGVRITRFLNGEFDTLENASLPKGKKKKAITYHTNCRVGDYHYFRTHNGFYVGRVQLSTGKVEYVQVPVQVVRTNKGEEFLYDKALENDVRNNDGFTVYQDKRATGNGWGHVSAASPIVVGDYLYAPTMVGTVYVIRWNAKTLDEKALVSVSDLGPAGKTWSLSSMTYDNGRLYARTMKALVCIGKR
jgi:outer membrane protein assembly factor BamB